MSRVPRRRFLQAGAASGMGWFAAQNALFANSPNELINIGIIGCGIRGNEHLAAFQKLPGVRIAGVCDPDRHRLDEATARIPGAHKCTDMRDLFKHSEIDAVVIATCNHWHALAAIWALEAGKHVYVEKPLSLTHWEGRQLVEAAKKSNKVVQVGTQQRSDPMQRELKQFLHKDHTLGNIEWVLVNRYGPRGSIGLRDMPLKPPESIDYDLWLGPAQELPIYRKTLHYDWHWDWNTGSGEMGNWGIHVLDDVRNVIFQDRVTIPNKIVAAGDRIGWHDAGNTPNLQFAVLAAGQTPVVISLCNLPDQRIGKAVLGTQGPPTGYVAFCENGRLEGERGMAQAFDKQGKLLREFKGETGERSHRQNFVDAIQANDPSLLNTPVEVGHHSTAWCNLVNIATHLSHDEATTTIEELVSELKLPAVANVFKHMQAIVRQHGSSGDSFRLGPILTCDPGTEQFTGNYASYANSMLRRPDRTRFLVPDYLAGS